MGPEPVLAVLLLLAAPPPPGQVVERTLAVPAPGTVAVTLDADVYDRARPDLGDLRVLDDTGRPVPYVLDRAGAAAPAQRRPLIRDRVFDRGSFARATLDFGEPALKDQLTLALSGESFRRRVTVEGRGRGEAAFAMLTDDAYVFAVPGPTRARYETVRLPENDFPELRVTVHHDADDPSRIEIVDAWTEARDRRRPREFALTPRLSRAVQASDRETYLVLDLGARHRPYAGVVLEVGDARFWRGVIVEERVEPRAGLPLAFSRVADRAVWRCVDAPRCGAGSAAAESLRIDVAGRARVLRLRIRNLDDRPLDVRGASVLVPVERLAFVAEPGRTYRLAYGDPRLGAPSYDLARTAGDPSRFAAGAGEAALGEPSAGPLAAAATGAPWTERHPQLLWGGLLAVVLALGAVTWQALRAA